MLSSLQSLSAREGRLLTRRKRLAGGEDEACEGCANVTESPRATREKKTERQVVGCMVADEVNDNEMINLP